MEMPDFCILYGYLASRHCGKGNETSHFYMIPDNAPMAATERFDRFDMQHVAADTGNSSPKGIEETDEVLNMGLRSCVVYYHGTTGEHTCHNGILG
jgi:hypothetical protein